MISVKKLDQEIKDVKLSGQLLIGQFTDVLGISAVILDEKIIDDTDFSKDVDLHFKMSKQLRQDILNSNLSKNEKVYRVENVLTYNVKYLQDLEKLLQLAKDKKFDKDNRWNTTFELLRTCIENFKNEIVLLEEYLQENV